MPTQCAAAHMRTSAQFTQRILNALHSFLNVLHAIGKRYTNARRISESAAGDCGNMRCVQQVHAHIIRIFDHIVPILLPKITADGGEHIKRTIGTCALNAGNFIHQLQNALTPAGKFFRHFHAGPKVAGERHNGRTLRNGIGAAGKLTL